MKMLKTMFVEDLKREIYCRLKPSPIHGVGVFAILDIPKGINPMQEFRSSAFWYIPVSKIMDDPDIPDGVKKLVKDMCPQEGTTYAIPQYSLNEIGVSYYLNHSKTPNMGEADGDFITLREIKEGEELTTDYGTYSELNLD